MTLSAKIDTLPKLQLNPLTPEESAVILNKATERPFSGKYYNFDEKGVYLCKHCNAPLFKSKDTRYCVNFLSLKFQKAVKPELKKAYFEGGCFWGC